MITVRRLKRISSGFFLGIVVGAVIGALGGLLDQGSMLILMPSGPAFWSIIGAFVGSIVGALYGAFSALSSKNVPSLKSKGGLRNGSDIN